MPNVLADAISPYLRSHADNPVAWQQWGATAFEEAVRRDVPVLISIGYSTCHWCHVMARESFSDPVLAEYLNEHFVAIKVDREEYPDVDSSYMTAASAFTEGLGWPLNVFVTPQGKAFFAGTYWPPAAAGGHPSFRQVLEAVTDAWTDRRDALESSATQVAEALASQAGRAGGALPDGDDFDQVVEHLLELEDERFGGFGTAPKFPVVPVLLFLLERGSLGDFAALGLAERTLRAMADSPLRDAVDGGFFRYATRQDWSEPHYERMLYDNAQLLSAYTRLSQLSESSRHRAIEVCKGIASFLLNVLRLPSGAFASAQDSESTVDGTRVEGAYYALDAAARAEQPAPALDEKVLSGWNGLAIDALAEAGFVLSRPEWTDAARAAADDLLAHHLLPASAPHSDTLPAGSPAGGPIAIPVASAAQTKESRALIRASVGDRPSAARATLEDYGMLARAFLHLGEVTGEVRYAVAGRELVDVTLADATLADATLVDVTLADANLTRGTAGAVPFSVPGGADPVLSGHGLAVGADPSEGAYASGFSAMASAAHRLYLLTAESRYLTAATDAMEQFAPLAVVQPMGFGAALGVMSGLTAAASQLVVVSNEIDSPMASVARGWQRSGAVSTVLTDATAASFAAAGFELFEARSTQPDSTGTSAPTAYLCRDFVCQLPVTDPAHLTSALHAP
ncbi:MAG: DUF255 domain-containing protein [Lacisediminihabitans sp.]